MSLNTELSKDLALMNQYKLPSGHKYLIPLEVPDTLLSALSV